MKDLFERALQNYEADRYIFENMPKPRTYKGLSAMHSITQEIPNSLRQITFLKDWYKIKGSVGQGNIAQIPHICIFDKDITLSAERGYYIVFLFDSTMSYLFLSLNQGWTQYKKQFKSNAKEVIKKASSRIQTSLTYPSQFNTKNISLQTNRGLGTGYELGNICSKTYKKGEIPQTSEIIRDIKELIGVYRNLKLILGRSPLNILSLNDEDHFQDQIQTLSEAQDPKPAQREAKSLVWKRSFKISAMALSKASHQCEADLEHQTFIAAKSDKMFVEAHHLVPMEFQEEYKQSLDIVENIISLCPLCHRKFHHAKKDVKNKLIEHFFEKRKAALKQKGIDININKLLYYYKTMEKLGI